MVLCYDDAESLALKAEYIKEKGLLGAMYWSIEADDKDWTLSKALASRLLSGDIPQEPENPEDDGLPEYQVTNQYMQDYMDQVTYNVDYRDKTTTYIRNFPGGGPGEADIPPSVMLAWDLNGYTGKTTLKVWDDEWSREYSLSAGTSKQELLNLVPNTKYNYAVTGSDNTTVAEGAFRTTGSIHQVYFSPADWSMSGEGADQFYDHARNVSTFRGVCGYVWSFNAATFKKNTCFQ